MYKFSWVFIFWKNVLLIICTLKFDLWSKKAGKHENIKAFVPKHFNTGEI